MKAPFIALTLGFTILAHAEKQDPQPVLLDALVTQALSDNPELKFYEAEIAAAKGERKASGAVANPEVSAEIGRKRVRGDISAEGTTWAVSVQQTFEWPGRLSLRKAVADRQIQLATIGLEQFRTALAGEIRRKAFELYSAQQRASAAREVSSRGEELVSTLVQRESTGVAPLLETRAIEASVIKLRRTSSEADHEARSALYELNRLRGKPMSDPLVVDKPQLSFGELPPVEELIGKAARNNFELKQREIELAQQGFKVSLSQNDAWPSITIGPKFTQENAADKETTAGLSISVPLPLWNRNAGNIETSKARLVQAQTSLQMAQRDVERRIREQSANFEAHRKEMSRWNANVAEQLKDAATLADRHYRLGAVPLSTYLEVQEKYLEALEAILATQADFLNAQSEIQLLTGKP